MALLSASAYGNDPSPATKDPSARPPVSAAPVRSTPKAAKPARGSEGGTRRSALAVVAGGDGGRLADSPELRALRDAERQLFPPLPAASTTAWPSDLGPGSTQDGEPAVLATGLPPALPPPLAPTPDDAQDDSKAWLARAHLDMPDLPVRWDDRVVRYLRFFRDDSRGHAMFANLYRHSGRWREMMRRTLRRKSLPEDIAWVSMIESGFDPTVHSRAGAAGLWQFMPDTARLYGLVLDRWLDQRLDAAVATEAAAEFLADLHRRFGSWELALAAFNMGSVGLASVVRRYNTNDFWSLSRIEGTLPWETTLYVPKVLAAAVVARNLAAFGFADVALDPDIETAEVLVPPGTPLGIVAQAAGCPTKEIEALNPELRASRTPPAAEGDAPYPVKVLQGKAEAAIRNLARLRRDQPPLDRYVVRFGETLEQIAAAHRTTSSRLVELNAISASEVVRGGTVLFVPHTESASAAAASPSSPAVSTPSSAQGGRATSTAGSKPSVVVPSDIFVYPDRRRIFYRVVATDTLDEVAGALHVSREDLCQWNDLDAAARLQEGMTLQAFVPEHADLSRILVLSEADVRVLAIGSDEFFAAIQQDKGMRRVVVSAKAGDTIESIGKRFDVSARTMERINRRSRRELLKSGESIVVYVPVPSSDRLDAKIGASVGDPLAADRTPNGPLPPPPAPSLLP